MIKYLAISILLIIVIALAYAKTPSPMVILEKNCYTCHNINIILKAKKNKDEWEKTIDRMILYGAKLNKEERKILLEFFKNS
jgi:hypothetical protein